MRIGVLGTGNVGRTLAAGIAARGNEVVIGTRNVEDLMARTEPDGMGNPAFPQWHADHREIEVATLAEAAGQSDLLINATAGEGSIEALTSAGAEHLDGKILIDVANAIDHSSGFPPSLFVGNTDSLGEQIQRAFPGARVVKGLNTMTAAIMVDPASLGDGDHTLFLCGDDADAKAEVTGHLTDWFGWRDILDLGDITAARGMEAYLTLWLRIFGAVGSPMLNVKVVR